jgi:hypothetical protein
MSFNWDEYGSCPLQASGTPKLCNADRADMIAEGKRLQEQERNALAAIGDAMMERDMARAELERAEADRDRLRSLLRQLEWSSFRSYNGSNRPACHVCGNWETFLPGVVDGHSGSHRPDCELNAALGEVKL